MFPLFIRFIERTSLRKLSIQTAVKPITGEYCVRLSLRERTEVRASTASCNAHRFLVAKVYYLALTGASRPSLPEGETAPRRYCDCKIHREIQLPSAICAVAISSNSVVMLAWRILLYSRVRSLMNSLALSVAFF